MDNNINLNKEKKVEESDNNSQNVSSMNKSSKKRGIYLLPNLLTTSALFGGFYAVIAAMSGHFEGAALAIFIAMILDGLDGRVARMTNTQSDFGAEYDSLSDMISFGIAPALIMYTWSLSSLGKIGWIASFIYVVGAALRLARFNTQIGSADKRYFQGLASPAAAGFVVGFVWLCAENDISGQSLNYLVLLFTVGAGLLMVSNVKYRSFKDLDLKNKVPFVTMLVMVLIFITIVYQPPFILFSIFALYTFSGLFGYLIRKLRKKPKEEQVE
ncbi:MAG: CDP-diacylglycerol--serine O-phosphatidyltransferase [gamma proteobacterium symbiont of Bathyaustriella thionipta]|nr:CDP-diacylglycerol--serine O-phosphatidyltransferase [gamma proteobacterium symbiont of Bathyaustriella thionipta]MCU7949725.1 CDP-diacylglycerol--serine O-phosphatidyltransferase [gamma proteobacterium symbiont of Bathyaustriella thionipta]MCU7954961.1 CDP-diacylglycerol--serine O-phosphatidyltransferase [gamma proteobacterium symbiont of Bathyaustriella thionipta]MCU7956307.1 CDP-diacylglycerol--serine O-phosphatidyltransferase [gamma proteobacterium symbiont of Bathyaustriella thionipta]M